MHPSEGILVKCRPTAQVSFGLLLGLVISAVIVLFLVGSMLKSYSRAPAVSRQERGMLQQEGLVDNEAAVSPAPPAASPSPASEPAATAAGHYRSSVDNYKEMLDNVQQQHADSLKAFEEAQ